jgi:branched-chain amino acid transport system substrate-binding protein
VAKEVRGEKIMTTTSSIIDRRQVIQGLLGSSAVSMPSILRAQTPTVKIGILQPMTGALAFDGQQGLNGAELAVKAINAAGGIKSLGGAQIEMVVGDCQSRPDAAAQEVEKMQEQGVSAVIGGYASPICFTASQTASRYDLPYIVDVGVSDQITSRGLTNTFRFCPGLGMVVRAALENIRKLNEDAGKPVKSVQLIREEGLFGQGLADLMSPELEKMGFDVLPPLTHPTPARDMGNIAIQVRSRKPDLIIPASYYGEASLLARTIQQQRIRPKAIFAVLNGAASNYRFLKENPDAAQYVMDCNHWYNPNNQEALALRKQLESNGQYFTYQLALNYACVKLAADSIERAASRDRTKILTAIRESRFADHIMPYGETNFVNGQNMGAAPVVTQVQGDDIKVIYPSAFSNAKPIFPMPA